MARNKTVIPRAPCARILMNAGAKRVSAPAMEAFSDVLEDLARDMAAQAVKVSKHAGRKTVQEEDIKLASKR